MTGIIGDLQVNKETMRQAADLGYITTDFADLLVCVLEIPFCEAHYITGCVVVLVEKNNVVFMI